MSAGRAGPRMDAESKASGSTKYVADIELPEMVYAAVTRSGYPHARIQSINTSAADEMPGVIGTFRASDLAVRPYGRAVRDIPALAESKVRYVGEPVVAVVASSRLEAERAAELVEIEYGMLPSATTPEDAVGARSGFGLRRRRHHTPTRWQPAVGRNGRFPCRSGRGTGELRICS